MIMSIDIKGLSANEAERLYNQGRLSKRELTAWVRLSAKLSGRIYKPVYRTGAVHDRVWLQRLEGAEEKLYAKRKARHASRDMHARKTLAEAHRALEADRNANELVLYAENTGELYEDFKKTSRMLRLQYQRGNYKRHAALVVWRIFARRAAKRYEREIKNSHFHVEKGVPLAAEYWEAALRDELLRSSNDPGSPKTYERHIGAHLVRFAFHAKTGIWSATLVGKGGQTLPLSTGKARSSREVEAAARRFLRKLRPANDPARRDRRDPGEFIVRYTRPGMESFDVVQKDEKSALEEAARARREGYRASVWHRTGIKFYPAEARTAQESTGWSHREKRVRG